MKDKALRSHDTQALNFPFCLLYPLKALHLKRLFIYPKIKEKTNY